LFLSLRRRANLFQQARGILLACPGGALKRGVELGLQSLLDLGADGPIGRGQLLDLACPVGGEGQVEHHLLRGIARKPQAHVLDGEFDTVQRRVRQAGLCRRRRAAQTGQDDQQDRRRSH